MLILQPPFHLKMGVQIQIILPCPSSFHPNEALYAPSFITFGEEGGGRWLLNTRF